MGNSDTIKLWFTYLTALAIVIGGFAFLFFSRLDPPESNTAALVPLIAGFIGAAITFLFNRETQTATARATERATNQGSATTAAATVAAATAAAPPGPAPEPAPVVDPNL